MRMWTQILVRSQGEPLTLLRAVRQQITKVNPDQQTFGRVDNLETWIKHEPEWARGRLVSTLFGGFSIVALTLAAAGLYSVMSYTVVQRTNEFGLRMALGAPRAHVFEIVFASASVSIGLGIGPGAALSFGLNRFITHWAENSAHDPLLLVGACILLISVAALACLLPAGRACLVDPMTALRCE